MSSVLFDEPGPRARIRNHIISAVTVVAVLLVLWEEAMIKCIEALPKYNRTIKRLFHQALKHYTFTISARHALGGAYLVPDVSDHLLQLAWTK